MYCCDRCRDKCFLIECACGCGGILAKRTKWGEKTCLNGHRLRSADGTETFNKVLGRWFIKMRSHPRADPSGRVRRAWIVYENSWKCCLLPGVNIHHKNEDPTDDRIENLQPLWRWQHTARHNYGNQYALRKNLGNKHSLGKRNRHNGTIRRQRMGT